MSMLAKSFDLYGGNVHQYMAFHKELEMMS